MRSPVASVLVCALLLGLGAHRAQAQELQTSAPSDEQERLLRLLSLRFRVSTVDPRVIEWRGPEGVVGRGVQVGLARRGHDPVLVERLEFASPEGARAFFDATIRATGTRARGAEHQNLAMDLAGAVVIRVRRLPASELSSRRILKVLWRHFGGRASSRDARFLSFGDGYAYAFESKVATPWVEEQVEEAIAKAKREAATGTLPQGDSVGEASLERGSGDFHSYVEVEGNLRRGRWSYENLVEASERAYRRALGLEPSKKPRSGIADQLR